jgi:hypothetical protein
MPNEFRLRLPEKSSSGSPLSNDVYQSGLSAQRGIKIMSINRVHEVFGHFFSSVFDKNEYTHKNIEVSLAKVYL